MDMLYMICSLLLLPVFIFSIYAQISVSSSFKKYSRVRNSSDITGAQAAKRILSANNISNVPVEAIGGNLTDHYDPVSKRLRLSEGVYNVESIAAIAVAAHECGHAIQDATGDALLSFRNTIFPVVKISSSLCWALLLGGMFFQITGLVTAGIVAFSLIVLFQLVTLPMEFNASKRALVQLEGTLAMSTEDLYGSRKVLSACALTYVASLAMSLVQLFRLIAIFGRRN